MPETGADQQEGRIPVGERAHHPGTTADLAHDAFERVIGAQRAPVFAGEGEVAEGLLDMVLYERGGGRQLHLVEFADDLEHLDPGGGAVLGGVHSLEHGRYWPDLGRGHQRPDVAVEVPDTALVRRLGKELAQALHQSEALVADNQLHALEPAGLQMAQETLPGGLVLLGVSRQDVVPQVEAGDGWFSL